MAIITSPADVAAKAEVKTSPVRPVSFSSSSSDDSEYPSPAQKRIKVEVTTDATVSPPTNRPRAYASTIVGALADGAAFTLHYLLKSIKTLLLLIYTPLAVAIVSYILLYAGLKAWNLARSEIWPVCWMPGISSSPFCAAGPPANVAAGGNHAQGDLNFEYLVNISQRSIHLLNATEDQANHVSLNLRRAGVVVQDIAVLVEHSSIRSRAAMGRTLNKIYSGLDTSGQCILDINAAVTGSLDLSQAFFETAGVRIREAQRISSSPIYKAVTHFTGKDVAQEAVLLEWETISASLEKLWRYILESALGCEDVFRQLDVDHKTLYELIIQERDMTEAEKQQALDDIWTFLGIVFGRDGAKLRSLDERLEVLKQIAHYRMLAIAYTKFALDHYKEMVAAIGDLRRRVATSELLGHAIAIDTQLRSLEIGVARVQEHWGYKRTALAAPDVRSWLAGP